MAIFAWVTMLVLNGCLGPDGITKTTLTKTELVEWYAKNLPNNDRLKIFGYQGSDDRYHYFITRPIDSFLMPRVPRSELIIDDERPREGLPKSQLYYYVVDPLKNFQKVSST